MCGIGFCELGLLGPANVEDMDLFNLFSEAKSVRDAATKW